MRVVFLVASENKQKAEDAVKRDDVVNRGSILLRSASALGFKEEGYFLVIDGSDEAISKARELLKDVAKRYEKKDEVLKRVDEEESSAIEGFGNILG